MSDKFKISDDPIINASYERGHTAVTNYIDKNEHTAQLRPTREVV